MYRWDWGGIGLFIVLVLTKFIIVFYFCNQITCLHFPEPH